MRIQKIKETFNDYRVEVSWGQLNAIFQALEGSHADPLADELYAELGWYLQNVPGPGEDEEEYKQAKEAEKAAVEGGGEAMGGENPDLLGQEVQAPEDETPGEPEGAQSPVPPEEPEMEEADRLLDRPPGHGGGGGGGGRQMTPAQNGAREFAA